MTLQNKKFAALVIFAFVTLSALFEFSVAYFFGGNPIQSALQEIAFYAVFVIACLILWFVGIKIMHLDAKGPVPWYASPVLWLCPLLIITLTIMFRGGV